MQRRRSRRATLTLLGLLAFSEGWLLRTPPIRRTTRLYTTDSRQRRTEQASSNDDDLPPGRLQRTAQLFFGSSQKEEPEPVEEESSKGFFRGLLRRGSSSNSKQEDTTTTSGRKKDARSKKNTEAPSKRTVRKELKQQSKERRKELKIAARKEKKDDDQADDSPSILGRVTSFFGSSNRTKDDDNTDTSQLSNSTNPLSVFQKVIRFSSDEQWVPIFPKTRISPGEVVPATVAGVDLLVVASRDGRQLYCIANSCPHLGTPLETGRIVRLPVEPSATEPPRADPKKPWTELEVTTILQQDGCEDCIVCPLHRTAFALSSGQVRGEWCPYPPFLGKLMGTVQQPTSVAIFDIRYRGKNVEVRLNSPVPR